MNFVSHIGWFGWLVGWWLEHRLNFVSCMGWFRRSVGWLVVDLFSSSVELPFCSSIQVWWCCLIG